MFDVSQSLVRTYRECQQKYHYRHVELLTPQRPKLQLVRGTMIGKCLDALAEQRHNRKAPAWQFELKPFEKQYGRLFAEEREEFGDPIRDVEFMVKRYERVYQKDGLKYLKGKDGKRSEIEVEVEIGNGIVFMGHIDKLVEDESGRVWDMDHKSHRVIPSPEDRFGDLQQVFYMWAAPLSGYPKLAGVIWDYLRTKLPTVPEVLKSGELSQRKNIDTDYETYHNAIILNKLDPSNYREILATLKARGSIDYFERVRLPNPPKELVTNVVDDMITTANEIKAFRRSGAKPVRSVSRNCKGCEFYELCQAEYRGLDAKYIRRSRYEINKEPRHDHSEA